MADIPAPLAHTVNAVLDKIADEAWQGDSYAISMSDCANTCDRSLWYSLHWASPQKPMTGQRASALETGKYWEGRLIGELIAAGIDVKFQQKKTSLIDGKLRGKLSGIATGFLEAPVTPHILECKALNSLKFNGVVKHKLEKHIPEHYAALQIKMHAEGLKRAAYYVVNKGNEERHLERVEYDPVFALAALSRLEYFACTETIPAKLHDDPTKKAAWRCGFCSHRDVCHEGAFARINCRTCLHGDVSDPELLKCRENGYVFRAYRQQQTGCSRHRFIPELVPGEQIDVADGRYVIYKLASGSLHVDGDKEIIPDHSSAVAPLAESDDEIPY